MQTLGFFLAIILRATTSLLLSPRTMFIINLNFLGPFLLGVLRLVFLCRFSSLVVSSSLVVALLVISILLLGNAVGRAFPDIRFLTLDVQVCTTAQTYNFCSVDISSSVRFLVYCQIYKCLPFSGSYF